MIRRGPNFLKGWRIWKDSCKEDTQMANEHMKRSWTSLGKCKTTVRYHFTSTETAKIKKRESNKCWQGGGVMRTLTHCWWKCKMVQPLCKSLAIHPRVKHSYNYDPAILLLVYTQDKWKHTSHKNLYTNVHSSIIPSSQKVQTTHHLTNE